MLLTQAIFRHWIQILFIALTNLISLSIFTYSGHAEHVLTLRLAATPLSRSMCGISNEHSSIRILAAKHRDLFLQKVPGQYRPKNSQDARKKDYVHFVTMADLTGGRIPNGAIAFDDRHAVIFDDTHPRGLSRPRFLSQLPDSQRGLAGMALNTFLRLHQVFNAAIDTCRPHPAFSDYENDDYVLRIENGKRTFKNLVQQYNSQPASPTNHSLYEPGTLGGFIDPDAGKASYLDYQAMNPLNFYVPTSLP